MVGKTRGRAGWWVAGCAALLFLAPVPALAQANVEGAPGSTAPAAPTGFASLFDA